MRIIKNSRLMEMAVRHPALLPAALHWKEIIKKTDFASLAALRRKLPSADQVRVKSGRIVTIFNLRNSHRLITAVHYNLSRVFILRLLSHAEYDKNHWKTEL
jgi:mRNA interferase HigB